MTITTKEVNFSWLRQDKEPDSYYKWFTYYRDMTGTRQIKKVIRSNFLKGVPFCYHPTFTSYLRFTKCMYLYI